MRTLICSILLLAMAAAGAGQAPDIWQSITADPAGDTRDATLADAAHLAYRYERDRDMLWLRVGFYGKPNADTFGVTITDAAGTRLRTLTNHHDNLQIRAGVDAVVIGVKRTDLADQMQLRVIVSVGSNEQWNDEIPNANMRVAAIDLAAARPVRGLTEIDVNRNNLRFPAAVKTLSARSNVPIVKTGRGRDAVILIPGVYSGRSVFDGFVKRNESRYTTYLLTPPGLNGTLPRPLPPESVSYGEYPWTRALEADIANLIDREKLVKPIVMVHGFPGSLAVHEIAARSPDLLGGIVDVATVAVQAAPSMKEPGKLASLAERVAVVNIAWADKWFKYVTPETWESNNYRASMLANDAAAAERARVQLESAPLEVKIRYLIEFMASDQSAALTSISVPILVLRPGFDDKILAEPGNAFYKTFFLDSWEPFAANPHIRLKTIPNARALLLDDQPAITDEAIKEFVKSVEKCSLCL